MKKQVWVIEDDPDIGDIIHFLLTEDGYEVTVFENATRFGAALTVDQKPDLFLMDVMLPDGNGVELCEVVKKNELLRDIPVIMMSAHATFAKIEQFCSADDFISKPFDINNLLEKISKQLS